VAVDIPEHLFTPWRISPCDAGRLFNIVTSTAKTKIHHNSRYVFPVIVDKMAGNITL